jgi:hypothetical protein
MGRWIALAAALMVTLAPPAEAGCEQDLEVVERVVPTLVLTGDLRREVEALQTEAGLSCHGGETASADSAIAELWRKLLESDDVTPPTVVELTVAPCSEGIDAVEQAIGDGNEIGEMGRDMANRLIDHARELCQSDESMAAEQKLALAWSILTEEGQ